MSNVKQYFVSLFKMPKFKAYLEFVLLLLMFLGIGVSISFKNGPVVNAAGNCPSGGYYCGNDGLGLNSGTLYYCSGGGATPSVSQNCSNGCKVNPAGTADACNPAPSGPCPSSGYYCGNDGLGLNASTLYYCSGSGANPSSNQSCSYGCKVNPSGTADACNPAPSGPCPSSGDYCGGSVGQNSNYLYNCSGSGANPTLKTQCSNGCQVNPSGTADVCKPSGACPTSGSYCGNDGLNLDANTLYTCSGTGANPQASQSCSYGCQVNPAGTADVCKPAPAGPCPSSGYYCGNDGLGLNASTLYYCSGSGANPTQNASCSNGCHVNPAGTADACNVPATGQCPGAGAYCGQSVGQNSNNLYNCSGAGATPTLNTSCSNGCHINPVGTADVCNAPVAPPPTACPSSGDYCGASVGQNPNNLYTCTAAGATAQLKQACSLGCHINPVGTKDVCTTATTTACPNGNGLYCGTSVGLNSNTLYQCTNGNFTVSASCSNGCQQNAPGVADACKTTTPPPSTSSDLIFPLMTGSQNVNQYKVEPGYTYGTGPFYIMPDCYGKNDPWTSSKRYHGGIDLILATAKGALEVDPTNPNDVSACNQGSFGSSVVAIGSGVISDMQVGDEGTRITEKLDVQDLGKTVYATYMHLKTEANKFKVGDSLSTGTILGTVGNFYPYVSNPHLHFQITTTADWGGGYSVSQNPDDNGYINPCTFFMRHNISQPGNCINVTPNGGQITSPNSDLTLTFPPNAINQNAFVQMNQLSGNYISPLDSNLSLAGNVYQLSATSASGVQITNFDQYVTVDISYNENLLIGKDVNHVSLYYYDLVAQKWIEVKGTKVIDTVKKVIHVLINHFSEYALLIPPDNPPKVISPIVGQTINQGQNFATINLGTFISDPDPTDTLTWSYSGNTNIKVSIANNIATLTYPATWSGSENITFKGSDNQGLNVSSTATFKVNPVTTSAVELLMSPWHLTGSNGASEFYQSIPTNVLAGKTTLRIKYDLHGLTALGADASAIIFDQNGWKYISLSNYGVNGMNGVQTVDIPLSAFTGLDLNLGSNTIHTRFWYGSTFTVDIYSIQVFGPGGGGVNNPPTITSTPVTTVNENSPYTYDVNATDPENNTLTYSLAQGKTGMTINSATGLINWTPSYSDSGTFTIIVKVSDGLNNVTQTYSLVVKNINRAPVVTQIPGQTINSGQLFSIINLASYGSDPDGDPISWTVSGNTNVKVAIASNIATLTYTTGWSGSENLVFKITDNQSASATSTATFKVNASTTNMAPTITSVPTPMVNENSLYTYDVNATDPENNTLTYSLTQGKTGMTINPTTGLINWTPGYSDAGTYTIIVNVSDGTNNVKQSFSLIVNNVNRAPIATQIPGQTINQGQTFTTINLGSYITDPDSDPLTWITTGNMYISVSITGNIATLTYLSSWSGSENITFKALDKFAASASSTATFKVNPSGTELLSAPWHLTGNNGASELYQTISSTALIGKTTLRITYDLHGLTALPGDASAIIFDQNGWQYISLSNYGVNGKNGSQTVDIPLSVFTGLNKTIGSTTLHTRFWYSSAFTVDITSIKVL